MVTAVLPGIGMRNALPLKMSDTKPRPSLSGCFTSPVGSMLNAPPKLNVRRSCNPLTKFVFTFSKQVALFAHSQFKFDSNQSLLSFSLAAGVAAEQLITATTSTATTYFKHIFSVVCDIIDSMRATILCSFCSYFLRILFRFENGKKTVCCCCVRRFFFFGTKKKLKQTNWLDECTRF